MIRPLTIGLTALVAVACAKEAPPADPPAAAPQEVTITATDYGYVLPTEPIHAGLTTITLVNQGKEVHHATLFHLKEGKTVDDYLAALQVKGPPPSWAVAVGGPNAAPAGGDANATLILESGAYALVCFIPSPDGVPHMAKGMVLGMQVEPSTGPVAALPTGDIKITLSDYSFAFSQAPTAGTHTFTVSNEGKEAHEVVLVSLPPEGTAERLGAWFEGPMDGPPPGAPVGGLAAMNTGQVENFTVNLPPGRYGLICFITAPDGAPHFVHGMAVTFTVS
jgi:hypothetical protein